MSLLVLHDWRPHTPTLLLRVEKSFVERIRRSTGYEVEITVSKLGVADAWAPHTTPILSRRYRR